MSLAGMTTALLIRHAQTDAVGAWLAGRDAQVSLNQVGRAQAERLRTRLRLTDFSAIYSSPLDRAIQTAAPLARERGLRVEPMMELIEVDFGQWTGARFDALAADPAWQRFNRTRSFADVPGGERALTVQSRIVQALDALRLRHPNQTIALISHADVIRLAVLHSAGAPIDFIHRFEISTASITGLALHDDGATLLYVNRTDCP
jgi:broad specificity phosphatase PhoE